MKVSIIIPSFGRASQLKRAIRSALNQTYSNIEIIIVDDNGLNTPNSVFTQNAIDSFSSEKIKLIRHKVNMGGSVARNTGIEHSEGYYVAFLDNDDEFEPTKIEKQVHCLKNLDNQNLGVVAHHSFWKNNMCVEVPEIPDTNNINFKILSGQINLGIGSTFLCPKRLLQNINGFDPSFKRHQDIEMILRFLEKFNFIFLPEVLSKIHIDDCSNIPTVDNLYKVKLHFFHKFKKEINKLNSSDKQKFYKSHYFELARTALRNWNFGKSLVFLKKSKTKPLDLADFVLECLKKAKKSFFFAS